MHSDTDTDHDVAPAAQAGTAGPSDEVRDDVFDVREMSVHYGDFAAVTDVTFAVPRHQITALIGPSGCGKSTVLRSFNRMNDLVSNARVGGEIRFNGEDIYHPDIDAGEVRRRIGMVFQKPNPFPKSIYDNVAYGPRLNGYRGDMDELVERALRAAALWDEVSGKLGSNGLSLSGGQQQRLCIARAIAVEPEVILMDEPCSALDPIATARIEDLMLEMKTRFTIVIVTHNMQQAARVSDHTAFFSIDMADDLAMRTGTLVEYDRSEVIFGRPANQRTEDYVSGRFG